MAQKAVILFSGGVDSSVCLAMAKAQGLDCYALSIDYNQRNRYELDCAARVAKQIGVVNYRTIRCEIGSWGGSALTDLNSVLDDYAQPQINTYVPARNSIFLSLALGWAETLGANIIFFGANAQDHDNYPDCRPEFFSAFSEIARFATRIGTAGDQCQIHTPLLRWSKTQIIREGQRLNIDFSLTFSCYDPIAYSQPCHQCLACHVRAEGFRAAPCF